MESLTWFFDGAMACEVAGSVNGDATSDKERAVDGADDLEGGDLGGRPGERVTAIGSGVREEQTGASESLQNLGQQRRRNVVGLGDILGALGGNAGHGGLLGEVLERHEAVIRFFGQTEHGVLLTLCGLLRQGAGLIRPYWSYLVYGWAGWRGKHGFSGAR
jgi:hypothetical protein